MTNMPPPSGTPVVEPVINAGLYIPPPKQPSTAWYATPWKLALVAGIVAFIVGAMIGGGGASSIKAENTAQVKKAKRDSKAMMVDAEKERAEILGSAGTEKDTLTADVAKLAAEKAKLAPQVVALKKELGKLTSEKKSSTFEGSGQYLIGSDIKPGTYKADASPGCYYAVMGKGDQIVSNNNVDGPVVLDVPASGGMYVEVSGCATFRRAG